MKRRDTSWAALALGLAITGVTFGQEVLNPKEEAPAAKQEVPAPKEEVTVAGVDTPAEARTPLMSLFDKAGFGSKLDELGVSITGWAEASVTFSLLDTPGDGIIVGRAFDYENQDPTLNQIGLNIARAVDTAKPWDVGFSFQGMYGADARFTASNGMDFQTGLSPENQFDITEATLDVIIPIGNGLKTRFGKFITPIGYEYTNNTLNANFSHTYLFGIIPFSHTGIYSTYAFDDSKSFSFGIARGWEQSLKDNNAAIEVVWSWAHTCSEKFNYAFNGSIGPQQDDDSGHYRTMLDYWSDYKFSDQLTIGLNVDYRYDSGDASDGDGANTYGVAGYFKYTLNDYIAINPRLEWFDDTQRSGGFDCNIYSATLGVTVTPFPSNAIGSNLKIRPELRYDYATEPIYDEGTNNNCMTAAISGYFTF